MAVRQFTLPVEPENDKKGQIAIIVDPATGYSPTVNSAGTLKVQTDATIELGDVQIKNKAGTAVVEPATDDTLLLILAKLIAAPSTAANQATLIAKDFATQTTLAAVLTKLSADASTATLQGTANTSLAQVAAVQGVSVSDAAVYGDNNGTNKAALRGLAASLYAVGDGTGALPGVMLAALTAVLGAATSDAAVYGDATGSVKAALRGLAASLYGVGDGTGDKPGVILKAVQTAVELIDNAISGTEMQVDVVAALPAGTNLLGKVGIDQTTPGTTNAVVEASAAAILAAKQAEAAGAEMVAASGIELLCVASATTYNTGAVLTAGVTYEVTAENGSIYLGVADTTTDANKEMAVPAGATRRFTMPATKTTLYYSTEDGAGVTGRLSRVA